MPSARKIKTRHWTRITRCEHRYMLTAAWWRQGRIVRYLDRYKTQSECRAAAATEDTP